MSAVSSVKHARRVGDRDGAGACRFKIDVVDAGAEIRDQLQVFARARENAGVEPVGDGGDQHVGGLNGLGQLLARHRRVVDVQARVEQFAHARFDDVGQLAGDDDEGFFCGHWR